MRFRLLPILLFSAVAATSYPAPLTPTQALSRAHNAKEFKKKGIASGKMRLVHTTADADSGSNCFYIFNQDNGGYMIVTADDRLPAVLAFSDKGCFNIDNIPPAMQWWLDGYKEQIIPYLNDESLKAPELSAEMSRYSFITPLLTTQWDQDAPYWNKTPELNGKHCLTGCVATAMAQVMNYHEWPERGTGSNSYRWSEGKRNLSADFEDYLFDWDNMLDRYTEDASAEEQDAVATLMYACGISVNMSYGTSASGAVSQRLVPALTNYFSYDKGTRYVSRTYYPENEWIRLIYDELKAGRPVLYGGNGSAGGHQFVCDGYSSDTKRFHFNWGWSGDSDGYFMINNLNPPTLGAGGGAGGFNTHQDVIIGVQKPTVENDYIPVIVAKGDFTSNYPFTPTTWSFREGSFFTTDNRDYTITPGVRFLDQEGNEIYFFSENTLDMPSANPQTGYTSGHKSFETVVDDSRLSIGEMYIVNPVFKYNDKIYPIRVPSYCTQSINLTAEPADEYPLDILYFDYTDAKPGAVCNMIFHLKNNTMSALGGMVSLAIFDNQLNLIDLHENIAMLDALESGATTKLSFEVAAGDLPEDLYYISLIANGVDNSEKLPWVIGKRIDTISLPKELEIMGDEPYTLSLSVTPSDATWQRYKWVSMNPEVATVDSNGTVYPHDDGTANISVKATDGSGAEARCLVKVSATSSATSINQEDESVIVYRIDGTIAPAGTIAELQNLDPGIYIVKSGTRQFKFIKRVR